MRRANNLTTFMCTLSWNMGELIQRKTQGSDQGLLLPLHEAFPERKDTSRVGR